MLVLISYLDHEVDRLSFCDDLIRRKIVPIDETTSVQYKCVSLEIITDGYVEEVTRARSWLDSIVVHDCHTCFTQRDCILGCELPTALEETLIIYEWIEHLGKFRI